MGKKAPKFPFLTCNIWPIHCWSPDFSRNWYLRIDPRPCVRPQNSQWLSIVLFWNFAWSYNFIWGECNILGFLQIILVAFPGALLWLKKPQSGLKWHFLPHNIWSIHPLCFSETRSKCGGNCTKYKTTVTDLGKILVRVPRGHLGLKKPLFGVVFWNLTNYWYVCLFSGFSWYGTKK